MKFRNMAMRYYMEQADDGTQGGGAGGAPEGEPEGSPEPKQVSYEEFQALQEQLKSLKGHNDKLLGEKKAEQQKRQEQEEARRQAELEAQRKAGNLEEFEKTLTETWAKKEAAWQEELKRRDEMILGGKRNELIAQLSGKFVSPEVAKLMVGQLIDVQYGDGNTISTSFKGINGEVVSTNAQAFEEYLMNTEAFAPYLKGVDSSGGMSGASRPAAGGGQASKMKRADFTRLSPNEQMKAIKNGTIITD